MLEILGPILELFSIVWSPIHKCWTYHKGLPDNMENLRRKAEALNARMQGLESRLTEETAVCFNKRVPNPEVQNWFRRLESARPHVETIEREYRNVTCCSRASLGKRVSKRIQEVDELHQWGGFLYSMDSLVVVAPSDHRLPTPDLFGESAKQKLEEIWAELMEGEAQKIGVHGMAGTGKTTIVKNIYNRLVVDKKFKNVLWVSAAEAKSLHQLQKNVASSLDRYEKDFSKYEDETTRAAMLYGTLREKDKWVLILDGLWEAFQLEHVGIPEPTHENGCKLLLTTQSVEACRVMGCKEIHVKHLPKEEAWNLFLDRVGGDLSRNLEIESIAKQVADECGCLPLAIVTVAASLRGIGDIREWRSVLKQLKKSGKGHKPMDKVLEKIKLSYNRLQPELQRCLLYCALYPENFDIEREELITYLVAEEIVEGDDSRQAEFDHWHSLLNRLREASLLELGSMGEKYVKMHDLVRDMAIQELNADKESLAVVEAGKQLTEWPSDGTWKKNPKRVSVMCNNISEVRSILLTDCRLQTLLLAKNKNLVRIPDSSFSNMQYLRVLDLSYTGITNLPNSISYMEKLVALFLKRCEQLRCLPSLAKLRALRELDLQFTGIKKLPQGIDMLTELRHLNLWIPGLEALPFGILDKLSRLQHLVLWLGSTALRLKGEELAYLTRLEMFKGQFHDLPSFNSFVRYYLCNRNEVKGYILQLGQDEKQQEQDCEKRIVLTKHISDKEQGADAILLPLDVEYLSVVDCHRVKFIYVSSFKMSIDVSSHSSLGDDNETLFVPLYSLTGDTDTYRKERAGIQPGAFSRIRFLKIESLPGIKNLFGFLPPFQHLEELVLYGCNQMEAILADAVAEKYKADMCGECNSGHSDKILMFELPKLRIFSLSLLPELRSILPGVVYCPSIEYITIQGCPKLTKFPLAPKINDNTITIPDSIEAIYLEEEQWWDSLDWYPDTFFKEVFQPFCRFLSKRSM